jgi:beta-alanine degradation protein BauB
MKRVFVSLGILALLSLAVFAQDPLKIAPDAYKLELENEWVKVTRVHYAPHAKIPAHDHTETGAAYVYLNDSGKVIFKHIGLSYGAITRPETKAGSFRLYKAVKEVHEVENPNDTPSDFLRVEFKTASDAAKPLRGKFYREAYLAGENFEKVQFENDQIRVTRLACAKACEVSASAGEPLLIVALTPLQFKPSGKSEPGKTKWVAAGKKEEVRNAGTGHAEFLRFDLKSKPTTEKEKPHAHPHE